MVVADQLDHPRHAALLRGHLGYQLHHGCLGSGVIEFRDGEHDRNPGPLDVADGRYFRPSRQVLAEIGQARPGGAVRVGAVAARDQDDPGGGRGARFQHVRPESVRGRVGRSRRFPDDEDHAGVAAVIGDIVLDPGHGIADIVGAVGPLRIRDETVGGIDAHQAQARKVVGHIAVAVLVAADETAAVEIHHHRLRVVVVAPRIDVNVEQVSLVRSIGDIAGDFDLVQSVGPRLLGIERGRLRGCHTLLRDAPDRGGEFRRHAVTELIRIPPLLLVRVRPAKLLQRQRGIRARRQ